jgi:site-specific DNA recombinase
MQKVAIYCRLSDEDRNKINPSRESESIQNQKAMLTAYAKENNMDIYKIYCDEDYSGVDANRPEFNKLLQDAEKQKFNIVLCKTQSRFTRDMIIVEDYIHNKFSEWGIRFIALLDNVDTANKGNKKARQINGLINEWYLEDLSENLKQVLANKKSRGQFTGAYPSYGYLKDENNKNRLVIDPEASQVVKQIFDWFVNEGYGINKIMEILNQSFIPNPSAYKKQKFPNYKNGKCTATHGELWNRATIRGILKNQIYLGHMVQGRVKKISYKNPKLVNVPKEDWIIVENTHEPIIDSEMFYKAQKKLTSNAHPDIKTGEKYMLAGKIKCMHCGSKLSKCYSKRYPYMRCRKQLQFKSGCDGITIGCMLLEKIVLENVIDYLRQCTVREDVRLEERQRIKNNIGNLESTKSLIEREINDVSNAIINLYVDKTKGVISEDIYPEMNNRLIQRKEELSDKLRFISKSIADEQQRYDTKTNIDEIVAKYGTTIKELTRNIVDELIEYVEVGFEDGEKSVKIHWIY